MPAAKADRSMIAATAMNIRKWSAWGVIVLEVLSVDFSN